QGVVHGDLKPANVMVGAFGEVQVMDWGFARRHDPESPQRPNPTATTTGAIHVLGTPAYMAPEQACGDERMVTARTDVFGLGAILGEILCGRPPYLSETRSETLAEAVQGSQEQIKQALRDCGADAVLIDLSLRCLDPDP